ncbi:EAL domain-containing protein [methane-oxidizing endosymbiont of Gigantopelta aegis]|uniref:EAL domain-containing protein n=1 Tax=methane-oxidizing endosymbiont of Gigantopelta aegis TaxID=2794938 RepID=UPI0018DBD9FC|nr:EAL domain-containing protein [methane-oxidizing endosymbiont of Gigantopelta aegis]
MALFYIFHSITSSFYAKFSFAKSIHTLAAGLSMQSVAEFIEDEKTLIFLRETGIEFGQGFFLGKPEPVNAWLIRNLYQVTPLS